MITYSQEHIIDMPIAHTDRVTVEIAHPPGELKHRYGFESLSQALEWLDANPLAFGETCTISQTLCLVERRQSRF